MVISYRLAKNFSTKLRKNKTRLRIELVGTLQEASTQKDTLQSLSREWRSRCQTVWKDAWFVKTRPSSERHPPPQLWLFARTHPPQNSGLCLHNRRFSPLCPVPAARGLLPRTVLLQGREALGARRPKTQLWGGGALLCILGP